MPSGRKERIVISCVTFEVAKIVDPVVYYEATKVHLIHYGNTGVYREFYDEVVRRIGNELPRAEIIEHDDDPVYEFDKMMKLVLNIIRQEQNANESPEIYVNVSAGPSEYTTASLIASMMMENITPFNVATKDYQIPADKVRELYFENGRPIGMTKTTRTPNVISAYSIQRPDEKLVLGLSILRDNLKVNKRAPAPVMIRELSKANLMEMHTVNDKPDQKTTMYYQRNFMNRWLEKGWVGKESRRDFKITDEGKTVLDVFLDCYNQ